MENKLASVEVPRWDPCPRCTKKRATATSIVLGAAAATAAYFFIVRPWHTKWGATKDEVDRLMPGDDLVADPTYVTNRAVTINSSPDKIWPWLAQIGEGRGGFYSYDFIENLMGMKIKSADTLLPEHYTLHTGEVVPAGKEGIPVIDVQENEFLLLGSEKPVDWGQSTWCIALFPEGKRTRVVSRVRARVVKSPSGWFLLAILDPGQFLMERKMLLGLKHRVEMFG